MSFEILVGVSFLIPVYVLLVSVVAVINAVIYLVELMVNEVKNILNF